MSTLLAGPPACQDTAAGPPGCQHTTAGRAEGAGPAGASAQRWLARGLVAAGMVMVPWLFVLATQLPASTRAWHWPLAWVGLDGLEALGLLATGILLARRDDRYRLTAVAAATLLVADAWFDVTTAAPGAQQLTALAMAACPELPVAALCLALALRRQPAGGPVPVPGRSGAAQ